jgi:hypothetical protein
MIRKGKNPDFASRLCVDEKCPGLKSDSSFTVIIFLAQNGRIRAVKFRLQNFGRISFDLGEISPKQQILRLQNGRNSPKSEEIRPKFFRANLNCAEK